jgi:4-amino-4-deoxy-L-arabinose transferase-like glycosyltransferase
MTWEENVQAGHWPAPELLIASRAPGALLAALSAVLMFWIGREVRGAGVGLAAALLSGFNALNLLHGRRAMAEGAALFFSLLAVWVLLRLRQTTVLPKPRLQPETRQPANALISLWTMFGPSVFAGVTLGLAMASKQTNLALLPVALLAGLNRSWRAASRAWLVSLVSGALTFWLLNPILYRDPVGVARAMIEARADLAQRQVADAERLFPGLATPTPLARLRAALLQVYLQPLAFWDIPIYTEALQPQVTAYQTNPLHTLTRQPAVGALLLGLTLIGIMFSARRLWRTRAVNAESLSWAWGAATLGLTLLAIPLDWQRYFLPLAPLAGLFSALGLEALAPLVWRLYEIRHHHQR